MSTVASSSSASGLPPPHHRKRSSPVVQPTTSPALSPSSSPLALPPQLKRPRKATATTTTPLTSPPSSSSPSHSPPSSTLPSLPSPPPTTYFCYLLRSLSPRHSGHTYIGFTTDPLRRLRQHNGDLTAGAYRTARRRPWQLVAAVSGFTSKVIALQFEWQWTYPRKSKRMRGVMEGRRWGGGVRGKVEIMYELLATQPWSSMPLQVRYAEEYGWAVHELVMKRSERERKEWEKVQVRLVDEEERKVERMKRHIYALPTHMPLTVGPFDQLDMYTYRRLRRERRKGRLESGEVASVTPGECGESELDDGGLDDEAMVSGEESDNSGESDVEIIEQPDNDNDDEWTSFPLTQPTSHHTTTATTSTNTAARPPSSSPPLTSNSAHTALSAHLRCGLCFRRSEVGEGGHGGFFSGCDQCRFVGHLTCIVQHIFKQMQSTEITSAAEHSTDFVLTQSTAQQLSAALSPPTRFASNPTSLFSPSPAFTPTIFSSFSPSLPLLPPPSTGTCPTCSARLSYPLLIERCRYMHESEDGRRGGDVWYEEADELSISLIVREYAGRAGELKAKEKEEKVKVKKQGVEGVERRKRKVKSTTAAAGSGDESSSTTDSSPSSSKRKRKSTKPTKRADTAAISPPAVSHSPPLLPLMWEGEPDKEDVTERETTKKKPTASRRVAMHDRTAVPPLFASSQPAPAAALPSSAASVRAAVSLSDDDDVLVVDELPSADKRRQLMAEAAERRLGKPTPIESRLSTQLETGIASDVSALAANVSGALHTTERIERPADAVSSRDYVQVDDDSDDVLALDTETEEDEMSGKSLFERLKARAESAQLVASLQDIQ